jgi:hypothetical protein
MQAEHGNKERQTQSANLPSFFHYHSVAFILKSVGRIPGFSSPPKTLNPWAFISSWDPLRGKPLE